eukprot:g2023.t1
MAFDSANRAAVRVQAAWRGHACRRRTVHRARRRFLKIAALLDTSAHAAAVLSGDALCRVEFPRSATLCRPVLAPRPPAPVRALSAARAQLSRALHERSALLRAEAMQKMHAMELAETMGLAVRGERITRERLGSAEAALAEARATLRQNEEDIANMTKRIEALETTCAEEAARSREAKETARMAEAARDGAVLQAQEAEATARDAEAAAEAQAREYRVLHARQLAEAERCRRMRARDDRDRLERGRREELRRQVIEAEERERHRRVSLAGSIAAVPSPSAGSGLGRFVGAMPCNTIRADSSSPSVYETSGGESSSEEGQRRRNKEESAARTQAMEEAERERRMNAHRDAEREARHARQRSIEKAIAASDKGRIERLEHKLHPEMFVKYLAFSDGGGALTAPAATEKEKATKASPSGTTTPARMTLSPSAVPLSSAPSEFPRPSWRGTPVYGERQLHTVPSSNPPLVDDMPAAAQLHVKSLPPETVFDNPPTNVMFRNGATPQFGERLPALCNGKVPPPPSTPPPLHSSSLSRIEDDNGKNHGIAADNNNDSGDDDDDDDEVVVGNSNDGKEEGYEDDIDGNEEHTAIVVEDSCKGVENDDGDEASEWVLVEIDDSIREINGGGIETDENDKIAGQSLSHRVDRKAPNVHTPLSDANTRSISTPELDRLGVRANMLSPEQLRSEITKINLAISSRKKLLLANVQTPSPLSWRQALSENAAFS